MVNGTNLPYDSEPDEDPYGGEPDDDVDEELSSVREMEETVEHYLAGAIEYGELVAELGEREATGVEAARRVLHRGDVEVGDGGE